VTAAIFNMEADLEPRLMYRRLWLNGCRASSPPPPVKSLLSKRTPCLGMLFKPEVAMMDSVFFLMQVMV
jgi:hypothetical protein